MDAELTDPLGRLLPGYTLGAELVRPRGGGTGSNISDADIAETLAWQHGAGNEDQAISNAVNTAKGITAYHGSPHYIGEEGFSNEKIGTGEGAQAYGYGHYFAEHEPVAHQFKGDPEERYRRFSGHMTPKEEMAFDLASQTGARDTDVLMGLAKKYGENIDYDEAQRLANQAMAKRGHMYEVHIDAHPDHFLDWDKPLSEQPHVMQKLIDAKAIHPSGALSFMYNETPQRGGEMYERLTSPLASHLTGGEGQKSASEFLKGIGVRGIKYLDAGSRGAGEGSRNYVVFDPKDIEIMRRYARGGDVRVGHAIGGRNGFAEGGVKMADNLSDNDAIQQALSQARSVDTSSLPGAVVQPYEPTWRDRLATWMLGDQPSFNKEQFVQGLVGSRGMGNTGFSLSDVTPVGQILGAQEAAKAGNYREAAMNVIPMEGALGHGLQSAESAALNVARNLNKVGMYSHGAEAAASLPQATGSVDQMVAMVRKQPGVKEQELVNAGLLTPEGKVHPDWASRGKISREDLSSHLQSSMPQVEETVLRRPNNPYPYRDSDEWSGAIQRAERNGDWDEAERLTHAWESQEGYGPSGTPKYESYTLPGSENYREVLLKLPPAQLDAETAGKRYYESFYRRGGEPAWENLTQDQKNDIINRIPGEGYTEAEKFRSSHWDDPNVLAHIRMADRTGPNGEKILHVEEVQSDWGQKGKKKGFYDPELPYEVFDTRNGNVLHRFATKQEAKQKAEELGFNNFIDYGSATKQTNAVPTAPYVTSTPGWTDLALKRVLKEAAEGGYDKVVWTPGAEQAKRYDLSQQVDSLLHKKNSDGTYQVSAQIQGRGQILGNGSLTESELADHVGKEIAEKIAKQEGTKINLGGNSASQPEDFWHELSGGNLKIGGEGMKDYYDNILPKRLQEVARRHDKSAKVGYTDVMLPPSGKRGSNNPPIQAPGIDITPQMRESILKGQGAFARGGRTFANNAIDNALRTARSRHASGGAAPDTDTLVQNLTDQIAGPESNHNPSAYNPASGAFGAYQMLPSTALSLQQKYHPEMGVDENGVALSNEQRLRQISINHELQTELATKLTDENINVLRSHGIDPTPGNVYAAHFIGSGAATRVLTSDPSTPMSKLISPKAIAANPMLANMTAGDFAAFTNRAMSGAKGQTRVAAAPDRHLPTVRTAQAPGPMPSFAIGAGEAAPVTNMQFAQADDPVLAALNVAKSTPAAQVQQQSNAPEQQTPPFMQELTKEQMSLPTIDGLNAVQWAKQHAFGDLSRVHGRVKYVDGQPRLQFYLA